MDQKKIIQPIPCPLHPKEHIQRVNLDFYSNKQIYCFECIMQPDPSFISSNLKTFEDFVSLAAKFYSQEKNSDERTLQNPLAEYEEFMKKQSVNIDNLTQHIEKEKEKVEEVFEELTQEVLKLISQKKAEYLNDLDNQLSNLRYWYQHFNRQFQKTYSTEEDKTFLFPSDDDLLTRLEKISNITQLNNFVKTIKDDLNEVEFAPDVKTTSGRKNYLHHLFRKLDQFEIKKPKFDEIAIKKINKEKQIINTINEVLQKSLVLKSPILDLIQGKYYVDSCLAQPEEFELIRKWLPMRTKFTPKLLYRFSSEGKSLEAFHELCDEKGPTITLIKAKCSFNEYYHERNWKGEDEGEEKEKRKRKIIHQKSFWVDF